MDLPLDHNTGTVQQKFCDCSIYKTINNYLGNKTNKFEKIKIQHQ